MLDQQRHGLGVAVDGADVEQRRFVGVSVFVYIVDVAAAFGGPVVEQGRFLVVFIAAVLIVVLIDGRCVCVSAYIGGRCVGVSVVVDVVDVPAARGRREHVQHVDDGLGVGRPGGDVERRVAGRVPNLDVGEFQLMNELARHVDVTGGDVQSRVSTRRLAALLIRQPEI